jgi:hypothetical protein
MMETFTQPKITGYRQLNEAEAALMNKIKAQGVELEALIFELLDAPDTDPRWINIGKSALQQGLMALVRGVARPTSF